MFIDLSHFKEINDAFGHSGAVHGRVGAPQQRLAVARVGRGEGDASEKSFGAHGGTFGRSSRALMEPMVVVMERRGRRSGQVTLVGCRACGEPVVLDPTHMVRRATHAELRCPACGADNRVRLSDLDKPRPEGIWSIDTYATPAAGLEMKARGITRLLRRTHHG